MACQSGSRFFCTKEMRSGIKSRQETKSCDVRRGVKTMRDEEELK